MKKLALLAVLAVTALNARAVPFIEDNYTKALAQAKAKNAQVFVEAWAPW